MARTNRKRHTKPCLYFQTDDCPLSADECDFAHVIATPEQYESLKNPQATLRTKPCKFYLAGQCRDGYWCRFKHPANAFSTTRASEASLLDDMPELESDKGTDDDVDVRDLDGTWKAKPEEHPKYRTRPCRNYILGKCIYGDRCSYLHVLPRPKTPVNGAPPPSVAAVSPRSPSYYPVTPPPHQAPPSTPLMSHNAGSEVDVFDLDSSVYKTPIRPRFNPDATPSTASAFSEEPITPATSGVTDYIPTARTRLPPPLPLSPLSPLSFARRDYRPKAPNTLDSWPMSPPLQPPLSMYSPTSPVPLQIVHVPFAVPMYPEVQSPSPTSRRIRANSRKNHPSRSRAFSQPALELGSNPKDGLPYRAKPCKFYAESGKCQKGDHCDFSHIRKAPTSPLGKRVTDQGQKEQLTSETENERQPSPDRQSSSDSKEAKSNNYYKINWRVVGGGVKMGTEKMEQRRHSEDASLHLQCRPSFRNPFDSMTGSLSSTTSALSPAINLKRCADIVRAANASRKSDTRKSVDEVLSLTLQSYSLAKASTSTEPMPQRGGVAPTVIVHDDAHEKNEQESTVSEKLVSVSRLEVARAKSSPSSPVTGIQGLPSVIFSAESP